jgi:Golgi SNAP receptor complex protein 2
MSRTIDDYDSMARREIIKAKQEKATSYVPHFQTIPTAADTHGPRTAQNKRATRRVQKFKSDYAEFRKEFERIKEEVRVGPARPFEIITHRFLLPSFFSIHISAQPPNEQSFSQRAPAHPSPPTPPADGSPPPRPLHT